MVIVILVVMEIVEKKTDIIKQVEELTELMRPHLVCTCADAVEGRFLENRLTYECRTCKGAIPLKWAKKTTLIS